MAHHVGHEPRRAHQRARRPASGSERFHADPLVRAAELLLHERIPRRLVLQEPQGARRRRGAARAGDRAARRPRARRRPTRPQPHVALLGHLPYTDHGEPLRRRVQPLRGRSPSPAGAPTATRDDTGQFCYVKDLATRPRLVRGAPAGVRAGRLVPRLPRDRPRHLPPRRRRRSRPAPRSPSCPTTAAEVRRVTRDQQRRRRRARSSSRATARSCSRRPTPTARTPRSATCSSRPSGTTGVRAITATRRPRSATEQPLWCVHVVDDGPGARRRRSPARPTARASSAAGARPATRRRSTADGPLSGTHRRGARSDLRAPHARAARARAVGVGRVHHARRPHAASAPSSWPTATTIRTPRSARSTSRGPRAQVELRELASRPATPRCSRSWPAISSTPSPRSAPRRPSSGGNRGSQPLLWAAGVSGDWPILLATIDSAEGLPTLRQLLAAHRYWRRRGMMVDLVVLDTHRAELPAGPGRPDHRRGLRRRPTAGALDRPGGVFVRRRDLLGADELLMLRATARVHIAVRRPLARPDPRAAADADRGAVDERARRRPAPRATPERRARTRLARDRARCDRDRLPARPTLLAGARRDRAGRASARTRPRPGARADAAAAALDNGLGGLDRRRRLRDPVCGDDAAAGAVGQRRSPTRTAGSSSPSGAAVHLGGEQLLLPAHAVAQRSGQRPGERGALPARRGQRRARGARRRRRSARPAPYTVRHGAGAIHLRARARRHRDELTLGMAADDRGEALAARG